MHYVQMVVEHGRLPEEHEGGAGFEAFVHPLDALEEHQFDFSRIVCRNNAHAGYHVVLELVRRQFGAVFGKQAHLHHGCTNLHLGEVRVNFCNGCNRTAVYITERIGVKEVSHRSHPKLALQ